MKRYVRLSLLTALALSVLNVPLSSAQTTIEEMWACPECVGGVHFNYPEPSSTLTKAPKGYKPFFINHIARHGSRYLVWEPDYTGPLSILHRADSLGVLTPLGKDVLMRCETIWDDASDRIGELTPLGEQQHRDVAERMFRHYPEVFRGGSHLIARSTQVPRCMLSMMAFCERLKELEPELSISRTASERDVPAIASVGYRYSAYRKTRSITPEAQAFIDEGINSDRLVSSLISDAAYADTSVNGKALMRSLFAIASIQQCCPHPVDMYDIFTDEEKFFMWQHGNYGWYMNDGPDPSSNGMNRLSQIALLRDFIYAADDAIANGNVSASLRFSHDSYIIPFTTTLMLSDCMGQSSDPSTVYKVWCDYKVCPMCANIQMVFYRNKVGDVIVKILHNENEVGIPVDTDMYPYYKWTDVKAFYKREYDYENNQSN